MSKVVNSGRPVAAPMVDRTARGMTTEAVLAAATEILERDGLLGLSMRSLATELGVSTSTVYWHAGTRDELLDKLIEQITDQLGNVQPEGREPLERIGSIIRSLLNEVRARPQLISLSATRGRGEAIFTKAQVALAHELAAAGVHGEDAAFALSTILFHLGGFVLLEHSLSHDYRVRGVTQWAEEDQELDPAMSASLRRGVDLDRVFDFTLEAILRDLLAAPDPSRARRRSR
jgi:TetR/AcrR family transcriptional regulator, tetracycline repressor protein